MFRKAAVLLLFAALSARAEVIDRIIAVVDGRIITLSDVRKEHAIQTALRDPVKTDSAILKDLIDGALLDGEMAQYPGLDVSDDEIAERMKEVSDLHGASITDIRKAVAGRIQRDKYFKLRYRPFIVISNAEVEKEYETNFVPEAKKRGHDVPELSQVGNEIREMLFDIQVAQDLETSLEALRMRSNVEVFQ